ncbi:phage holin family protein [Microbacterium hydrocarbonoxydans]|uniref:phage holin family protein n=1 Tax=Microbacterium hydrocarbonoxydans TaxID=273678 RepID=UPI00203AB352|nr:phage holin family protein [Microbacterium hydrocarbonoxydans]MCM3779200.1 phage holin family protein [Microbacterium hydrocarbonoxydans]
MIAFLFRAAMYLVSAALGLIVADLLLDGFRIQWDRWWGFVVCIVVFAVVQSILAPIASRLAHRHAPALVGGMGIISTLVALVVVVLLPFGGLRIVDASGWLLGALIVWIVTALGSVLLPRLFLKKPDAERRR